MFHMFSPQYVCTQDNFILILAFKKKTKTKQEQTAKLMKFCVTGKNREGRAYGTLANILSFNLDAFYCDPIFAIFIQEELFAPIHRFHVW